MDLKKADEIDQGITELTILQNRLRVDLEKSSRAARALAKFRRMTREYEKRWRRPVAQWQAEMKARLDAGLRRNAGMRLTEPAVDKLIDWDEFDKWTINHFKPIMSETLSAGGNSAMRGRRIVKAGGGFDPLTQAALDWLTIHALDLVHDINGKSRAGLIQMILDGIKAGTNPRDIAIKLRKYVGVTGRMAQAAANREAWLIINRPELGPAAIKGAMDAYTRKQIRYRAELISRTETAYGLNEGIREGYGQLGYTKLQRIEDPEGDPEWDCTCRENNGAIYTLEESQGVLPEHPNCILGDTRIIAPGIKKGYSASYNGPVAKIVLNTGRNITSTINHMFLTPKGFASAAHLKPGDEVFYYPDFKEKGGMKIEALIERIKLSEKSKSFSIKSKPEFLHGDGLNADSILVSVPDIDSYLNCSTDAIIEHLSKDVLPIEGGLYDQATFLKTEQEGHIIGRCLYPLNKFLSSLLIPLVRLKRRLFFDGNIQVPLLDAYDKMLFLFLSGGVGIRHFESGAHVPFYSSLPDVSIDREHTSFLLNCAHVLDFFSRALFHNRPSKGPYILDSFDDGKSCKYPYNHYTGGNWQSQSEIWSELARSADKLSEGKRRSSPYYLNRKTGGQIENIPRFMKIAKVIKKTISHYSGVVYDLETSSSLYVANGLLSSNCEGTWVAYSD